MDGRSLAEKGIGVGTCPRMCENCRHLRIYTTCVRARTRLCDSMPYSNHEYNESDVFTVGTVCELPST